MAKLSKQEQLNKIKHELYKSEDLQVSLFMDGKLGSFISYDIFKKSEEIVKLMEYEIFIPNHGIRKLVYNTSYYYKDTINYRYSFDWIIPVVLKIQNQIQYHTFKEQYPNFQLFNINSIIETFLNCLTYIKWFNKLEK